MTLTLIAILNAILWSGVITGLLLYMMRQNGHLEEQATRLEAKLDERTKDSGQ